MAKEIVSLMPPHRSHLEPFFGSGGVLFNKTPSAIETINDIDGQVVNFFRVCQEQPEQLAEALAATPYARDIFNNAHADIGTTPLDQAIRFAVRSKMGHGFKVHTQTGFKIDVYARERSYCVNAWNRLPQHIIEAAERLKGVQIENRPALEVIQKFNHDNVLIYADPPYLPETRTGGRMYRHEMTEQDHVELLEAMIQHKGPVILSGYASDMYDYTLRKWDRIERKSYNQKSDPRTEVIWCNFQVAPSLFDYMDTEV